LVRFIRAVFVFARTEINLSSTHVALADKLVKLEYRTEILNYKNLPNGFS